MLFFFFVCVCDGVFYSTGEVDGSSAGPSVSLNCSAGRFLVSMDWGDTKRPVIDSLFVLCNDGTLTTCVRIIVLACMQLNNSLLSKIALNTQLVLLQHAP